MKFEWDQAKDAKTLRDRGFDFGYAVRIFDGAIVIKVDDRKSYGETRLKALGGQAGRKDCYGNHANDLGRGYGTSSEY